MTPADGLKAKDNSNARDPLSAHYNASHLRTDSWDSLKDLARRLERADSRDEECSLLVASVNRMFDVLEPIESYWCFPGKYLLSELKQTFEDGDYHEFSKHTRQLLRYLVSDYYRSQASGANNYGDLDDVNTSNHSNIEHAPDRDVSSARPYFEVLVVDDLNSREQIDVRNQLIELRGQEDDFIYDVVIVPTFEDALIAILFNHNIQSVVIRYSFPFRSKHHLEVLQRIINNLDREGMESASDRDRSLALSAMIKKLRPELDIYMVTDAPVEEIARKVTRDIRRVFYRQEDYRELHFSILRGIHARYSTPFFTALRQYSKKPTGVFHAMPISRGKSISKSHWIRDMEKFYGTNIFLAETSSTKGGLDSLLQPHGTLKEAQENAARAFGSKRTFFVTNGTSTANKIVMQALVRPGDIVLVSRDCHKSHHYALILAGAFPVYMDPYPISEYSMYGAVSLETIKKNLLDLKSEGKLDQVRMLLLTNCTFDGVTYNARRVMEEVLAIKPDIIFLWDEAWFAFAQFTPTTRNRMGMQSARNLRDMLKSSRYKEEYKQWKASNSALLNNQDEMITSQLFPDPELARVRVYTTQSTHKTLTALRQGSMIHIYDQDFETQAEDTFLEAYMTHTSTSPNYQILASLDVGRRQVELEGYELVSKCVELAMMLRERVHSSPLLKKYFSVLGPVNLIPNEFRPSGIEYYYDPETGWARMEEAWTLDQFALDPTRVTLQIARTGMDGDTFRDFLSEHHDIQINKTTRNTVLFMVHIGTTQGAIVQLLETLTNIAEELDEKEELQRDEERGIHTSKVHSLVNELPPLPNFSAFHGSFRRNPNSISIEGDMRKAYFLAYNHDCCTYMKMDGSIAKALEEGRVIVSAVFVTPYPPGFPVLVPGQLVSQEILQFLKALDVKEIHGYNPHYGLKIFTDKALDECKNLRNNSLSFM
ncbi:MAG: aminotransferase class I/II-fold pyridoxal phosphate-dependent enzyme [Sumerlaeia bacterium]